MLTGMPGVLGQARESIIYDLGPRARRIGGDPEGELVGVYLAVEHGTGFLKLALNGGIGLRHAACQDLRAERCEYWLYT